MVYANHSFKMNIVLDEKYRLERLLGQGGMGVVYLALHLGTERYVALKLITPQFMLNEELVERFRREARAAGRLRHPNVVDVTDFGFATLGEERVGYLVMEYLDGCTLADVLAEEERLPLEWVVDILEQVCSAVHEAHQQGVVHRDLKPENIWLEPNQLGSYRVKVLDFGIAKLGEAEGGDDVSSDGHRVGNPDESQPLAPTIITDPETDTLIFPADASRGTPASVDTPNPLEELGHQVKTPELADGDGTRILPRTPELADADGTRILPRAPETSRLAQPDRGARRTNEAEDGEKTRMFAQGTKRRNALPLATQRPEGLTRIGAVVGTPQYMSPEQCRGGPLDARSDIYSLGVIAYQMLAGEPPFTGGAASVMMKHMDAAPVPLRQRARKVPRRAEHVVMTALAKDPAARPESAAAFANSLRGYSEGLSALYRRAFALYFEHFPKFLYLSLIAHIPVIVCTLLVIVLTLTEKALPRPLFVTAIIILAVLQIVSYFVAASTISGVTTVMVTQMYVAPLWPVQLRTAFAVLRRRWRPFLRTSVSVTLRIMLGFLLFIIPGFVMSVRYSMWAPVVLMEGIARKEARRRARELAARSWRTVITVAALQFAIPMTVSIALNRFTFGMHHQVTPGLKVYQNLSGLANIFVIPLMSIVPALLYLRMRQMGGESLTETLAQVEEVEAARSRWQQRMRTRLTVSTSGNRT
jgi:serine/threonine protein kinase